MINPLIVHGQMVGGLVQGLGAALLEELVYDEHGQLLTTSLADHLLPTAPDFGRLHCVSLELARSTTNPLGVKAAGEGGVVAVAVTIANAVDAALVSFGAQVNVLPLSPLRIREMIETAPAAPASAQRRSR
jgi:carbon-monoxide dehydrogenase large subunit